MNKVVSKFRALAVGTKLSAIAFVLIILVFGIFVWATEYSTSSMLEQRTNEELTAKTKSVIDMMDIFNADLKREANRSVRIFEGAFPGKFSLDAATKVEVAGKSTPALKSGGSTVNNDFSIPDRFSSRSAVPATVFVKSGDDFVRISTSLKNAAGERAVGTVLDRAHPSFQRLQAGESYGGTATLFGKKYFTHYAPIKDEGGKVIGALFVGVDFTEDVKIIKERINALKVGTSGYFYVLDANDGKSYGDVVVDRKREGLNLLGLKGADGREIVKEILTKKNGLLQYMAKGEADGETSARERSVTFGEFKDWKWIVVGSTFTDEITAEMTRMRNYIAFGGLIAVLLLTVFLYLAIRNTVARPLAIATALAQKISNGDLTARTETNRDDEIGRLLKAINSISLGLANVVWNVRNGTQTIATASKEIASGNQDLSSRTEQQASSLEETASSMEELTSTVRQNADNARQANQLAVTASDIAAKGGEVVSQVVDTMHSIHESSKKIADIISVIDGIAFQTNILALNAAVEAARAGEQGRGFAVVATEVRSLAQRSAGAAREIKSLIDDSVGRVEVGNKLVDQAGATMHEVVTSIRRVTDIMAEITEASREQSEGIEQVNQAITQMDTVTQQNAALVEQAAAAAESLQGQAGELVKQVEIFKLKSTQMGTADEAIDLVKKAVTAIKERGRADTFADISNPLGGYTDRDLYVVVYDINGKNHAHGANAKLIGQDLINAKDGAGNPFVRDRVEIAKTQGSGWQNYSFLNPVSKQIEPKSMYLEKYDDLIVGCGIYK